MRLPYPVYPPPQPWPTALVRISVSTKIMAWAARCRLHDSSLLLSSWHSPPGRAPLLSQVPLWRHGHFNTRVMQPVADIYIHVCHANCSQHFEYAYVMRARTNIEYTCHVTCGQHLNTQVSQPSWLTPSCTRATCTTACSLMPILLQAWQLETPLSRSCLDLTCCCCPWPADALWPSYTLSGHVGRSHLPRGA